MARHDDLSIFLILGAAFGVLYYLSLQGFEEEPGEVTDQMNSFSGPFLSPGSLSTSGQGRAFIQQAEGWRREAYQDTGGRWTIGVGHLIVAGDGLSPQSVLTDGEVLQLFENDLAERENQVKSVVTVALSQNMFDALVDFVFNLGIGNLIKSTLLRLLNSGDYAGASAEFPKWANAARRVAEQRIFVA